MSDDNIGIGKRVLAFAIDLIFLVLITNVIQNLYFLDFLKFNFGEVGRFNLSVSLLPPLIWFVYFFICDLFAKASLGKIILSLEVSSLTEDEVNFRQILIRNLTKSFVSPILLIGFIMAFFNKERLALHDKTSNTKIVLKREKALS